MTKLDIVSEVFKSGKLNIRKTVSGFWVYFCWDLLCEDCPCDKEICNIIFSNGKTLYATELEEFYEKYPEARLV